MAASPARPPRDTTQPDTHRHLVRRPALTIERALQSLQLAGVLCFSPRGRGLQLNLLARPPRQQVGEPSVLGGKANDLRLKSGPPVIIGPVTGRRHAAEVRADRGVDGSRVRHQVRPARPGDGGSAARSAGRPAVLTGIVGMARAEPGDDRQLQDP